MEKGYTLGRMEKSTMANGQMELSKGMEFGREAWGSLISVNGKTVKQMVMVCISGRMVTDMKVSGKHACVMEMARTSSPMETPILVSTNQESQKDMGSIDGIMETLTQGCSIMD